jgi:hypothetical protein
MANVSPASEGLPAAVRPSWWVRFWHEPVRAEGLALMRILLGVALLTDQLFQYLPNMAEFFGPHGVAPQGLHDRSQLANWRWTVLLFNTDDLFVVHAVFWVWVAATACFTLGLCTRLMNVVVWFLTMCFIYRNPNILNGGDDTLGVALFLLMLAPTGRALSLDAVLRRRLGAPDVPAYVPPWSVRVLQVQLCMIYLSTGLIKLKGEWGLGEPFRFAGTWWDGTSIHHVLNLFTMSRWSFAQLPLPFWLTAALTYGCVWWEALFTPLVLFRWTRAVALWFGVLFHLGIYFTIEVGWFSFYMLPFYAVWIPDWFWKRRDRKDEAPR